MAGRVCASMTLRKRGWLDPVLYLTKSNLGEPTSAVAHNDQTKGNRLLGRGRKTRTRENRAGDPAIFPPVLVVGLRAKETGEGKNPVLGMSRGNADEAVCSCELYDSVTGGGLHPMDLGQRSRSNFFVQHTDSFEVAEAC